MRFLVPTLAAVLFYAGCSKQPAQPEPKPAAPSTEVAPKTEQQSPPMQAPANVPVAEQPRTAEEAAVAAKEAASVEHSYVSTPDFSTRVQLIYKLSDQDSPEAVTVLGRIFHMENDADLRVEVIDSLVDIDGLDDKKVAILTAAAGADQPKEVREAAIDALTEIDPQKALPILQAMAGDPDEEIRDAVKDAIEVAQEMIAHPQ